ncbi:hypothetical protein EBR44_02445 [bacterium]|nr:hypothetical protein [bacterium]
MRTRDCAAVSAAWRFVAMRGSAAQFPAARDTIDIAHGSVTIQRIKVLSANVDRIEESVSVVFTNREGNPWIFVTFSFKEGRLMSIGPPYQ